jgi:lysozyme
MNNQLAEHLIKTNEGFKPTAYKDTLGNLTIGYGFEISHNGLSKEECDWILKKRIEKCEEELKSIFINYSDYETNVKAVLIDMMFNLGRPKFLTFKNFIRAIKDNDIETAVKEMRNSKWYKQVPNRVERDIHVLLTGAVNYE